METFRPKITSRLIAGAKQFAKPICMIAHLECLDFWINYQSDKQETKEIND